MKQNRYNRKEWKLKFILLLLLTGYFIHPSKAAVYELPKAAKLSNSPHAAFIKQADDIVVKGKVKVVDINGKNEETLPGISVLEKGTKNGTSTDINGDYTIRVKDDATLVFSMVGYKTAEVKVDGKSIINITLKQDITQLPEVAVTGYQNIRKGLFTGTTTTLKGDDIKQQGIVDVGRMLEGRAAGVSVQNVSGTFGAAPKIRIRGATSITGENKPLWVIDGVILEDVVNISNEQLSTGDATTLIGSAVAGLNADDIASIDILKDAAATAQYGARAMNGVIVVSTKKGRIGPPQVSYTSNFSTSLKPNYNTFNIMNSSDQMSVYSELERKGWFNHASTARAASGGVFTKMYQLINTYDPSTGNFGLQNTPEARAAFLQRYAQANTNWFDILFKNSLLQEHSLSISSGTKESQVYFSASYLGDNGWAIGNKVNRYTANINANFNLSDKVTLNFISTGSIRRQQAPGTLGIVSNPVEGGYSRDFDINPYAYALNTSRTISAYDEQGKREFFTRDYAPFNILNELQNNTLDLNILDLKFQGSFNYKITPDFKYNFLGSMRHVKTGTEHKIRENSNRAMAYRASGDSYIQERNRFLYRNPDNLEAQPIVVLPYGGFYNTSDNFLNAYVLSNSLEYNTTFKKKHLFNVFALQEFRFANRQNKANTGYGYQFDKGGVPFIDPNIIKQAVEGNVNYYGTNNYYDRFAAFMARAAYSYDDRYSVNATARYDGSNKLGRSPKARWLPTWNVGAAWNADKENFLKNRFSWLDKLTLRATYGLTASLGAATNASLVLRNASTLRPYLSETESAMNIEALENSELTWEKQYETNLGTDLAFFKNRLTLSVDVYNRNGFDLISPMRTAGIGGEYIKNANYADMKTRGIELSLGGTIIKSKDWNLKSNFNFGYSKNKVTNLKGTLRIIDLVLADGGPQEGFPYRGLYSVDFKGLKPASGVPRFINEKGELSSSVYAQSDELKYLKYEGPTDPVFTGGFYNSVQYKSLTLSALITFSAGNKVRLNPAFSSSYSDINAMPREFNDRWVLPGDEKRTNIPSIADRETVASIRGIYPYNIYNYSSVRVADGGFIRLKNVSLSYTLPVKWIKNIGLKNASISAVANNPLLIYADKKLNGQDPEFFSSGGVALPIPKQYTLSLKIGI